MKVDVAKYGVIVSNAASLTPHQWSIHARSRVSLYWDLRETDVRARLRAINSYRRYHLCLPSGGVDQTTAEYAAVTTHGRNVNHSVQLNDWDVPALRRCHTDIQGGPEKK